MERKAKAVKTEEKEDVKMDVLNEGPRVRFKHDGGGSFWLHGHIIKPGQVFYAKPSEVPQAFRDQLVPLDGIPDPDKKPVVGVVSVFNIVPVEGEEDKFNVVNEKGKAINGKPLTAEKAESLLKDLQA